jgi:sortase A
VAAPGGARSSSVVVGGRRGEILAGLLLAVGVVHLGLGTWIHVKAWIGQCLLQRAWARTVAGASEVRPWPWADTWPVARLRVPAHAIDLIVLDGVSGATLAWAPGHASGSAEPGQAGTAVVSGHRDTHFGFLARMRPGDEILVDTARHTTLRFVVREVAVVDARTAVIRRDGGGGAGLVLLTCYPFDAVRPGGPLRYAVSAEVTSTAARRTSSH